MRSNFSRSGSAAVLVVSAVILTAVILLYFFMPSLKPGNVEGPKGAIARRDCELIAASITKYERTEAKKLGFLIDLKKSYLPGADSMKDPWNNFYQLDTVKKTIFSKGPDATADNGDDIAVSYAGGIGDTKFPLHNASRQGDIEKMKAQLKNNASVGLYDEEERQPLYYAAISQNPEAVKLLIQSGASVNMKNKNGETTLFQAAKSGLPGAVLVLADNGADVNAYAKHCETPLMRFAAAGNLEGVRILIEKGAGHSLIDDNGETALDKALKNNKTKVAEFLRMCGAKKK